jgi:hypothetical protein
MSLWDYFAETPAETTKTPSFWDYFSPAEAPSGEISQAAQNAPAACVFDENLVFWGMNNIPANAATKNFLIMGTVGTGKSIAIQLFVQSIADRFRVEREDPQQLIIFDGKCDIVPTLAAMGFSLKDDNVWLINPCDERSAVWDLANYASSPVMARHLAAQFIPAETKSSAPYYWQTARRLLHATILALSKRSDDWTLRDLLCAVDSWEHIQQVTACLPRAHRVVKGIMGDDQHAGGVLSTIQTKLDPFEEAAALWHTAKDPKKFSIETFLSRSGVLILGHDPVLYESIGPINRLILKTLTEHILRVPVNIHHPRHWFIFDEFTGMGKVEIIHELLNRGRSKGASVLIGLQGVEGIREEKLYGQKGANDMLEMCGSKTFLRAGGPATAEYMVTTIGTYRRVEPVFSETWTEQGYQSSVQYQVAERTVFVSNFFTDVLPFTGPGLPYVAVSDLPSLNSTLITRRSFDEVFSWMKKPDEKTDALRPRADAADQLVKPWSETEEEKYCSAPTSTTESKKGADEGPKPPRRGDRFRNRPGTGRKNEPDE